MRILVYLLAFFAIACSLKRERPVVERNKFVEVLIDLSVNEGLFSGTYNLDSASATILAQRNKQTLEKYKISKADFVATYAYYDKNKEELLEVYQQAIDSIDARRARLEKAK